MAAGAVAIRAIRRARVQGYAARMGGIALRECPFWVGSRNPAVETYAEEWEKGWKAAESELFDSAFCANDPRHGMY